MLTHATWIDTDCFINNERIQKFKEAGDSRYIYKKELDKACFQHYMACGDFEDLAKIAASNKVLIDKALILLKILNMMDIKDILLLWFINYLIKSHM